MGAINARYDIARSTKTTVLTGTSVNLTVPQFIGGVVIGNTSAAIGVLLPTPTMEMKNRECAFLGRGSAALTLSGRTTGHGFGVGASAAVDRLIISHGVEARVTVRDTDNAGTLRYFCLNPVAPS